MRWELIGPGIYYDKLKNIDVRAIFLTLYRSDEAGRSRQHKSVYRCVHWSSQRVVFDLAGIYYMRLIKLISKIVLSFFSIAFAALFQTYCFRRERRESRRVALTIGLRWSTTILRARLFATLSRCARKIFVGGQCGEIMEFSYWQHVLPVMV